MTDSGVVRGIAHEEENEISLFGLGAFFLRWRWMIVIPALLGMILGLAAGLLSTRVFVSSATFIPQGSEGTSAGFALASQLGIRVPTISGAWGLPIYIELLHSRVLQEPIVFDTVVVAERGGARIAFVDLLEVAAPTPAKRATLAVRALDRLVSTTEDKKLGAVKLNVTTPWPSVSLAVTERLLRRMIEFTLETRKSQAKAERQFVETLAGEAERALRRAEDGLQEFLQRNRAFATSPQLQFEHDRLGREVALRQQVYTTLLQSREEARIREVRDTPVITMLANPQLPAYGESRGSIQKSMLGGIAGAVLGVLAAFITQALAVARKEPTDESRRFFELLESVSPGFLMRK